MREEGLDTEAVHGPHRGQWNGPVTTPVVRASTFVAEDTATTDALYEGRREGHIYSRYGNPTVESAAERVARLEGGDRCILFSSGMAAISTTALAFARAGGRVLAQQELYGGTAKLVGTVLPRLGVRVERFPGEDPKALERLLATPADLVLLETPTNPTLRLVDLEAAATAARAAGVPTMVDSTFASPVNSRPLGLGIDLVMHSATKYLAGHCDLTAGAVVGRADLMARVLDTHTVLGAVLDPDAAFLLERGLKTLPLRVRKSNANAQALAERLARHPKVQRVNYPGLPGHPQHALAKRQMPGGFGGLLSFDVEGGSKDAAARFVDALRVVRNAASLGGVESLVSLPVVQSHRGQSADALAAQGITPGTVRLACGVEDVEDLWADLAQALEKV